MENHVNQKLTARGNAVPVLWRDSAWRVPIFVRTRIGAKRRMGSPLDRGIGHWDHKPRAHATPAKAGTPYLVCREIAGLPGLKIWNVVPSRRCDRRNFAAASLGRSTALGAQRARVVPGLLRPGIGCVRGTAWPRATVLPGDQGLVATGPARISWQPKDGVPVAYGVRRKRTASRLQPLLAFAASQLGGIALSRLRIYSVFE
jgi:hypothetical protein